jgi:hypothetical protein
VSAVVRPMRLIMACTSAEDPTRATVDRITQMRSKVLGRRVPVAQRDHNNAARPA